MKSWVIPLFLVGFLSIWGLRFLPFTTTRATSSPQTRASYDFIGYINQWAPRFKTRHVDGKSLYEICQNKYESYRFLVKLGIPIPYLYYYGPLDGINFFTLPSSFVIKTIRGYGSKTVYPFRNGVNQFDNTVGIEKVVEKLQGRLCLVEEFLKNPEGAEAIPNDYKVFCFDGFPELVLLKRYGNSSYRHQYYTVPEWKPVKEEIRTAPRDTPVPRPKELDEMLGIARTLGQFFRNNVVRLDFYITGRGVVFGEFTPHPFGGVAYTPFGERYLNKLMRKHQIFSII